MHSPKNGLRVAGQVHGFALVEMMIAMALVVVVLMITSNIFSSLVRSISTQSKSAESHVEGIAGLEMLRYDLEHVGFGIPWSYPSGTAFSFVEVAAADSPIGGIDSSSFNETTPPRPVIAAASTGVAYPLNKAVSATTGTSSSHLAAHMAAPASRARRRS